MPKREKEPIERMHVHLYASDLEKLRDHYSDSIGVAKAIRQIIRHYVQTKLVNPLDERVAQSQRAKIVNEEGINVE